MKRGFAIGALVAGLTLRGGAATAADVSVAVDKSDFATKLLCPLTNVATALNELPWRADGLNRYFILALDREQRYGQCRFVENNGILNCELSTGAFGPKGLFELTGEQAAAIERKGFARAGTEANYARDFPAANQLEIAEASRVLLALLQEIYATDWRQRVTFRAPSLGAKLRGIVRRRCVPLS